MDRSKSFSLQVSRRGPPQPAAAAGLCLSCGAGSFSGRISQLVLLCPRAGPITIGGRSDHNRNRHFMGSMRSVAVYSSALTPAEINCVFTHDDATFSQQMATPATGGAMMARPAMVGLMLISMILAWWQ